MDREHLTRLAQDPALTGSDDVADLLGLVQRYPWFSGAHLLLAVGGHRQGDVLFEEQLRASVAHLPSRAVLHDRLQAEAMPKPKLPAATPPGPAMMAVVREGTPQVAGVPPSMANDGFAVPAEDASGADTMTGEVPAVPPEQTVAPADTAPKAEAATITDDATPPPPAMPAVDPLDAQMRQEALAARYALMLEHPAIAGAPSIGDAARTRPVAAGKASAAARPPVRRFSDWLDEHAADKPASDPGMPVNVGDDEFEDTQALIDRFISRQGQEAPKPGFYSPVQAARRSVEEHADLVTETLARIFERQGNVQKAIAAYERLAQMHPGRSAHFLEQAARLKA